MEPRCPKRACSGWNNGQKQKQRTKKTEKIMKKMKTTILTSVALAACVSTQLFAQNAKEDVITIQATGSRQNSVSTSPTVANYGYWSDPQVPGKDGVFYYKTAPVKFTEQDLIHCMAYVLWGNAGHYSTTAKLVLDQGELSGFFG